MTSPSGTPGYPGDTAEALQEALAAEHAAIWVYELTSAFLPAGLDSELNDGAVAHRARRDGTERLLTEHGVTPQPAQPAYQLPAPVNGTPSAYAALVTAEADAAQGWRGVLERTDDPALRKAAMDSLTATAVRLTRWRIRAGQTPSAVALPGQPG